MTATGQAFVGGVFAGISLRILVSFLTWAMFRAKPDTP
jgi:hypothetical protein|tara:strand:+ start:434 stop:547 length:114 start_codon:yes stop_codon:yes gene_type:complete